MRRPIAEAHLEDQICERLRDLRLQRQTQHIRNGGGCWGNPFTQEAVGQRLGVSNTTVWRWENDPGYHPRSLARFDRWARILGSSFKDEFLAVVGDAVAGAMAQAMVSRPAEGEGAGAEEREQA